MGISIAERQRRRELRESILTEEYLRNTYVEQGLSANQIAESLRSVDDTLTASAVIEYLQKHRIPTRTVKQACSLPERKKRLEETCLEKYGATNPLSKGTEPMARRDRTVIERYGVSNVRQAPEVIKRIKQSKFQNGALGNCNPAAISAAFQRRWSDPEWAAKYSEKVSSRAKRRWKKLSLDERKNVIDKLCEGHATWWVNLGAEERKAFLQKARFVSKLETDFFDLAEKELGIIIERQVTISSHRYAYDGRIKGTNILLEVNGTFFHADPREYAITDELAFPDKQIHTAEYIWKRDAAKIEAAQNLNFEVQVFWEKDIRECLEIELGRLWREYADYVDQRDLKSEQEIRSSD